MLDQALCRYLGHEFVALVHPLAAVEPQGEGQGVLDFFDCCRPEPSGICHRGTVAGAVEQSKNFESSPSPLQLGSRVTG